jgi:HD-like signal output (HDOD) protein
VLSIHIFSQFETDLLSKEDVQYLWDHSLKTSSYAKRIAMRECAPQTVVDDSFTAGLLHDTGKLILASALKEQYKKVLEVMKATGEGLHAAEFQVLGCSHAEVAAYLFGIWGLPGTIIEIAAWHHSPSESMPAKFSALAAVHFASAYDEEKTPFWLQDRTPLDIGFLKQIGCLEREKLWRKTLEGTDLEGSSL